MIASFNMIEEPLRSEKILRTHWEQNKRQQHNHLPSCSAKLGQVWQSPWAPRSPVPSNWSHGGRRAWTELDMCVLCVWKWAIYPFNCHFNGKACFTRGIWGKPANLFWDKPTTVGSSLGYRDDLWWDAMVCHECFGIDKGLETATTKKTYIYN